MHITTEDYVERARQVHGDMYDYSKTEFVNWKTKVLIVCPRHGEFMQDPYNHLRGCKCPVCAGYSTVTFDDFLERARKVHGNRFIYCREDFVNMGTEMRMECPVHGEFRQKPFVHLKSYGCPECSSRRRCYGKY